MKTVLIIDGDLIAYRNAAAAEGRNVIVSHLPSGKDKRFKNRTEFKNFLKAKNFDYKEEDYVIVDEQVPEDVANCLSLVKRQIDNLVQLTFADSYEVYLGSGDTFRNRLPLPKPYKGQRTNMLKPVHLDSAREYLLKHKNAELVRDIETDDMVVIRAYEELEKGNHPILASIDKDSMQCQGITILNWMKDPIKIKKIPDVGSLRKEGSGFKGEGLMFLAYQALAGDPTDAYCGYDLSDVPYGPTKAFKAFSELSTEKDILLALIAEYKKLYPKPFDYIDCHGDVHTNCTWKEMLEMYWKCAYMKRSRNDPSDFWEFAKTKGLIND